jgi:hypothetical protein
LILSPVHLLASSADDRWFEGDKGLSVGLPQVWSTTTNGELTNQQDNVRKQKVTTSITDWLLMGADKAARYSRKIAK